MNYASPGVLLVPLKSSHGCLALVGCTIYHHNPESSQGTLGCKVTTRPLHSKGFFFFSFEKVPLLFIEKLTVYECQAHHRWEILLLQLSMFQGNTPSDHEWKKSRNQFMKMYLINTIYPGKNLFLSQVSVWHVVKSLQLTSSTSTSICLSP